MAKGQKNGMIFILRQMIRQPQSNKYNLIIMKGTYIQRNRESSQALRSQHRKYIKKPSPDSSAIYFPEGEKDKQKNRQRNKSNQQISLLQQLVPQFVNSSNPYNSRYGDKNKSNINTSAGSGSYYGKSEPHSKSKSKIGVKDNISRDLSQCQLIGISQSKNFLADRRKKGKTSFQKKIIDISNSQLFFLQQSKVPTTKQVSKGSSASEGEPTIQSTETDVEQLHYKMVEFMQKCKKAIAN